MKTNKLVIIILSLVAGLAISSCVQDDDYTIPSALGAEENAALEILLETATEISVSDVKAMYTGDSEIEKIENDIYVKGFVSSSDRTGNFFKEFYIQDKAENPTGAIKIIVNQVDTYNQFNLGREVYISLKGLYIGEERVGNGIITIGGGKETDQYGTTVTSINKIQVESNLLRSQTTLELVPLSVTFLQISSDHVGLFVQVDNVEFAENLNGEAYFDPIQQYDTKRTMQSCQGFGYVEFNLETSSFSDFKEQLLPTGNGYIKAVVNKTFDGSSFVLALNSIDDISMEGTRCSLLNIEGFTTSFSEDFETMSIGTTIASNGWTAYAEVGNYNWRALTNSDSGNPGPGNIVASMGAYNSGTTVNIAWLISPIINLDAVDLEFLNFQTSNSFSDNSELELLISTDWDGTQSNVSSATWTTLPGNIVSDDTDYQSWIDSGSIDLSSYSGNAYVAFKYSGGDSTLGDNDGTFEIDNFKILAEN